MVKRSVKKSRSVKHRKNKLLKSMKKLKHGGNRRKSRRTSRGLRRRRRSSRIRRSMKGGGFFGGDEPEETTIKKDEELLEKLISNIEDKIRENSEDHSKMKKLIVEYITLESDEFKDEKLKKSIKSLAEVIENLEDNKMSVDEIKELCKKELELKGSSDSSNEWSYRIVSFIIGALSTFVLGEGISLIKDKVSSGGSGDGGNK